MHEPNLQNVAKDFIVKIGGYTSSFIIHKILKKKKQIFISVIAFIDSVTENVSCRSAFKVDSKRTLVSADFCQLELRILTHLSEDPKLIGIMKSKEDIFTTIASKWHRVAAEEVCSIFRNSIETATHIFCCR